MPVRQRARPGRGAGTTGPASRSPAPRQDHGDHAGHRDARGVGRRARSPPATPRCRSSRRSTTRARGLRGRGVVVPAGAAPPRSGPGVGTWLNFAPDHLDVHRRPRGLRGGQGQPVGRVDRATTWPSPTPTTRWCCATHRGERGWRPSVSVDAGRLARRRRPAAAARRRRRCCTVDELPAVAAARRRQRPGRRRDRPSAAARRSTACADALATFSGLPHRVELVGEAGGVRWYDDSKATAPHATLAAVSAFDSVVLIAGGRNKGLDLGAAGRASRHGCAPSSPSARPRGEVDAAFDGVRPGVHGRVDGRRGRRGRDAAAQPGDAVLLSPGCASFDWYRSYARAGRRLRPRRAGRAGPRDGRRRPAPGARAPRGRVAPRPGGGPLAASRRLPGTATGNVLAVGRHRRGAQPDRPGDGAVGVVGRRAATRPGRPGPTSPARPRGPCSVSVGLVVFVALDRRLVAAALPRRAAGVGRAARGGAGPGRRRQRQRRDALARRRPVPDPAVGVRQARRCSLFVADLLAGRAREIDDPTPHVLAR